MMNKIALVLIFLIAMPTLAKKPSSGFACPAPDESTTAGSVIINEFSYHGDTSNDDWIELYVTDGPQDLNGWTFILKGSGSIDETITIGNVTMPWNNTTSGRFMVFASSTNDLSIQDGITSGALVENLNLFIQPQISLHNTKQEILLLDASGNLVHYIANGQVNNPKFEYDCVSKYPDYADEIRENGNEDQACTAVDGLSNGAISNDWEAGCNGETTPGKANNAASLLDHYQIEHNANGKTDTAETIVIKACANTDCSVLLSEAETTDIVLTGGSGNFSASTLRFSNGRATTSLSVTTPEIVTLGLQNQSPNGTYKCIDNLNENTCNINFTSSSTTASQCAVLFPNGASTHSAGGTISFGFNSQLIGSDDNLLATTIISKNEGSSKNTCNTADCTAAGTPSTPASSVSFQSTTSTVDVTVGFDEDVVIGSGSFSGNEFNSINPGGSSQATITFSGTHSDYFVDKLVMGFQNTLYLQAGVTYWINELTLNSLADIIVLGTGTALIYVNQSFSFPSNGLINSPSIKSSGDASKLVMYAFADVTLNSNSTFSGSLYAQGDLTLISSSYIYGAVSAANIQLDSDSTITYQSAEVAETDFGLLCGNKIDHFEIQHNGQGFTCEAKTLTIKACANESCSSLYDQETFITMSPTDWEGGNEFVFTGEITANLNVTSESTITLARTAASADAALRCFNGSTETCDIEFVDAGFEFIGATINDKILPDQIAETNFENVNLRAVQRGTTSDPAPLACEPAIIESRAVTFGYACDEPESCLTPLIVSATNSIAAPGAGEGSQSVNLNFNTEGIASLTGLNYADAGSLILSATATLNGGTILRGTGNVDVIPASLRLSVTDTNLPYVDSDDKYVYRAGAAFEYTIGAYGSAGKLLPNYQPKQLQFQVIRDYPTETATVNGNFNGGIGIISSEVSNLLLPEPEFIDVTEPKFNGGLYTNSEAYYSETGRISLNVRDANYLGNQIDSQSNLSLGTFIPAYYEVISNTAPKLIDTCGEPINPGDPDGFSYLGQNIEVSVAAEIQIAAKNVQGLVTRNFNSSDDWAWLSSRATAANIEWLDKNVSIDVDFSGTPDISIDSMTGSQGQGQRLLAISNMQIAYEKGSSPIEPFSGVLNMHFLPGFFTNMTYASDPGGASICLQMDYAPANVCNTETNFSLLSDFNNVLTISDIGTTELRWGRLILENTYGPENENLLLGVSTEYFSNNRFERNIDDNCTAHNFTQANFKRFDKSDDAETTAISILDSSYTLISGQTYGIDGIKVQNSTPIIGEYLIELQPIGDATITWDDYLQFDWNGAAAGFGNPSATITFGQFRGNDRIIQWREVFN